MNNKKQLAAMGAELRLTEEQVKELANRIPQTGALQIIDDEPLCMAKRFEELEAQARVMAELLREVRPSIEFEVADGECSEDLLQRIDAALAGKMQVPVVPEGWKLVPVEPTFDMSDAGAKYEESVSRHDHVTYAGIYRAMLAAAPKPEAK